LSAGIHPEELRDLDLELPAVARLPACGELVRERTPSLRYTLERFQADGLGAQAERPGDLVEDRECLLEGLVCRPLLPLAALDGSAR
jgi:hypothetical protein